MATLKKTTPIGTAWTISGTAGIAPISVYGPCCPPDGSYARGNNAAFFGCGDLPVGNIWQDLTTAASQTYAVSFEYEAITAATLQTMLASATSGPSPASFLGGTNMKTGATSDLS